MGIKGLKPFLARMGFIPVKVALRDFAGCAVGIDALGFLYATYAVVLGEEVGRIDVLQDSPEMPRIRDAMKFRVVRFLLSWLNCGVTPVMVFDGEAPVEKNATRAKRKEEKSRRKKALEELKANVLDATGEDVEKARKLAATAALPKDEVALIRGFLEDLGLPCLRAKGEGEKLCAMGARDGQFAAVYSRDTDNLAHGCPLLLTDLDLSGKEPVVVCYELESVLQTLQISFPCFVDLCIMAGCDYNTNIPNVALMKSFPLLKEWGTIDRLPAKLDISSLNHVRCRELFARVPFEALVEGDAGAEEKAGAKAYRLAVDPQRFRETGLEALRAAELVETFYEDVERGLDGVGRPMLLRAFALQRPGKS